MPTTTVSTIGSGGDYSTLQAWEDAAPANLVSSDVIWEGRLISAATNLTSSSRLLLVSGSTTDSTRYKHLTTATGASFRDNANVQTNALRWNSSNGASIECTGSYVYGIDVQEANFHISKLQVRGTGSGAGAAIPLYGNSASDGLVAEFCIFESNQTSGAGGVAAGETSTWKNCLFIQRGASASNIVYATLNSAFYNCTLVVPSDVAAATRGVRAEYGTVTFTNSVIAGATADFSLLASSVSATTSYTTDASPTSGMTGLTYAGAFVTSTTAASDFRIGTGSALKDVGTTDSTNAPTDIAGTARPSGTSYDVGCWEFVTAAGPTPTTRVMLLSVG